jgi:probable transposase
VGWSGPLPAEPSSVTVTLDGAGSYHAWFVVQVGETPLPRITTAVGVDVSLSTLAALSEGRREGNPRWFRQRQEALCRSQRNLSRKQKGSKNKKKARRRVARLHRSPIASWRRGQHLLDRPALATPLQQGLDPDARPLRPLNQGERLTVPREHLAAVVPLPGRVIAG